MNEKSYEINSISYQIRIIEGIPYLGLDVNQTDNSAAKRLYERLGYHAVSEVHLDGVYEYTDEQGSQGKYEDWCIDMIKRM